MISVHQFNVLDPEQTRDLVRPCLDVARWVDGVVGGRPYTSVDELFTTARTVADPLTGAELEAAMAHHPRIGEQAGGSSAEAGLSRTEQEGLGLDDDVQRRLAEGNRAYEQRFGRVFLIRASGRSAQEILRQLQLRLDHDVDTEDEVVADQLRQIALVRLAGVVEPVSYVTAHVLDAAAGRPAVDVEIILVGDEGSVLGAGRTDPDGRVAELGPDALDPGTYTVRFGSGDYFAAHGVECFHPHISVTFSVVAGQAHYHIPLLLSPYAYTTYRGS